MAAADGVSDEEASTTMPAPGGGWCAPGAGLFAPLPYDLPGVDDQLTISKVTMSRGGIEIEWPKYRLIASGWTCERRGRRGRWYVRRIQGVEARTSYDQGAIRESVVIVARFWSGRRARAFTARMREMDVHLELLQRN